MTKKVFKARMILVFSEQISPFLSRFRGEAIFEFTSADGIWGTIQLSDIENQEAESFSATVTIETDRKRMFPDFESYLECVKTVIGHNSKLSVIGLKDIKHTFCRTLDHVKVIKSVNKLQIGEDLDGEFYLIDPTAIQKVISCYSSEKDAETSALNRG